MNAIRYIPEPSLGVQLAAVKQNSFAITYIPERLLYKEVILAVVKKNGFDIRFIPQALQTLEVQLAAVKQNSFAIMNIPQPFIEVQLAAVEQNSRALEFIDEPIALEVQLAAVNKNGIAIRFIKDPSLEVQIAAVKNNNRAIRFIKDPIKNIKYFGYTSKKLESDTECLIMGDAIAEGDYYKMCSVKADHIISFENWLKLEPQQCNNCCYCKGELLKEIFCNSLSKLE